MKSQTGDLNVRSNDAVAIVGMSCDLPGANTTPGEFWSFLLQRKCGIIEVPEDRWGASVFFDPNPDAIAKSVSKWAGFVDDIRGFDAKFFGISPREAAGMDPQQRLVLQGAVNAMLDANIPLEEFSRQRTGVFIGVSQSEYRTLQEMRLTSHEAYAGTGYALCINANRISHRLNLTGPSYAIDTACSSSLTALDQAIHNLRAGACEMAIVGGVNAMTHPSPFLAFSKAGMISPTGRISTFDASANGFVRGEGAGMIVIKPLSRAEADGDRIHAVIRATCTNQDGSTNTITAPSQQAQIAMLRNLFDSVDIRPEQVGFVEAHGTGTPVGDPIEAGAIGTVIGQNVPDRAVYIGSSKANVGHLESGAGIVGLIKAAMAVKSGIVPPNIHFKNPNPRIPFDILNLQVPVKPEAFPDTGGTHYAVVNSFGFGGANACALISSPPVSSRDYHPVPAAKSTDASRVSEELPLLFPISGASEAALFGNAAALLKAMRPKGSLANISLGDLSAALAFNRSHLMHRAVIFARTEREFKTALRRLTAGKTDAKNIVTGQVRDGGKICFTFSGQGSQWWAMARELLEHNTSFADAVDAFDAHFITHSGWSIKDELLKDQGSSRINDTTVTQPALFAIQSGLAAVWAQLGVTPDMVIGHSIGEAAASFVANGLSLNGAAKFLSKRGVIRDRLGAKGTMAAIGLNHNDVAEILPDDGTLGIAAINGPGSTTISGDFDAVHAFVEDFEMLRPDTFIRVLAVDTAWHSHHLDAGEAWFRNEMSSIDWAVPDLTFISSVTGMPETRFDTDYGWLNLRRPVMFQAAVETALKLGATTFLELGPAATLTGPTKSTALEAGAQVSVLSSLTRTGSNFDDLAHAAASLFVQGHPLDWAAVSGTPSRFVELPPYAWQNEAFWQDSEESRSLLNVGIKHPFLGQSERGRGTTWTSEINLRAYDFLTDHRMQQDVIFPAAGYIDAMTAMGREIFGPDKVIEVENAVIHEALFIAQDQDVLFSSIFDADRGKVKVYSRVRDAEDDWTLRCEARMRAVGAKPPAVRLFNSDRAGLHSVPTEFIYDLETTSQFINYGPSFQTVTDLWMTSSKTYARVEMASGAKPSSFRHNIHPTLLDGCLQVLEPSMTLKRVRAGRKPTDPVCLPIGIGRMRIFADFPDVVFVEADQVSNSSALEQTAGFTVRDADGHVLMIAEDVRVRILPSGESGVEGEEFPAHFARQDLVELYDEPEISPIAGKWLLLEAGTGQDKALADALAENGADLHRVARAELGNDPGGALVDLVGRTIEDGRLAGIVVAWPLAVARIGGDVDTEALFAPMDACVKDMIALGELMDYARASANGLPQIVILASGAYPDPEVGTAGAEILSQMPIAALARSLATEAPEYSVRLIDADSGHLAAPDVLAQTIMSPGLETELLLRGDRRFAPRLVRVLADDFDSKLIRVRDQDQDQETNFHATMSSPGVIDNLGLSEIPLEPVGAGQVRVQVAAVGLNFRDIMAVTGLLPVEAEPEPAWQNLGLEFGAVVVAVGDDVIHLKPGDRVMGLGKRCLQRFKTVDASAVTLLPDDISLAQASTIPSAFATAHYALNHVGRMRRGERVFIHVATGGVGTAAVQLAKAAGAEIFATAGNPAKRRLLRELGVDHVMDSRSLKFADDVMRITKGKGVDILLNSLPGDYIAKGLEIMAPYGRFLEIGKRDVYEDAAVGLKALRRNVSLSVLDLASMGSERPDLMGQMFRELAEMLETKGLSPLPYTSFPVSKVADAIRYMSQAKHVGKVVVTLDDAEFEVRRDEHRPAALSQEGSYLITGGTGGFSLSIADWMSKAGGGELILASRSGQVEKANAAFIERLRKRGTMITVIALDVTDSAAVDDFVRSRRDGDRPLRGILHGAAVIKDGFANQLTPDMITSVLSPKIRGAWNLHRAVEREGISLDFLIGFSSISQVIGSAGQCNYVVGNAFLDALALFRRSNGQTGAAIDWGSIADAGFVARNAALASYLESVGLHGLRRKEFGAALELAITRDAPNFVYSRADWAQIVRANAALGSSPRMSSVLKASTGSQREIRERLMRLEGDELVDAARDYIMEEVANVLKIEKSAIQPERPMSELGLDSLSSFELKIRIETALEYSLPVSKFLQAPSVDELAQILASEVAVIRREEEAAQLRQDDLSEAGASGSLERPPKASNRQRGLLRDALSPMTSAHARRAMEHRGAISLPENCDPSTLRRAVEKLKRRHVLLKMRIDKDGHLHLDGPGPNVTEAGAGSEDLLDVANDEYLRLVTQPDGQTLNITMHAAMGDRASCDVLMHELTMLLLGQTLPRPIPRRAVLSAVAANCYDPEEAQCQTDQAFWWYALVADRPSAVPFPGRGRAMLPPGLGRNQGAAQQLTGELPCNLSEVSLLCRFANGLRLATNSKGPVLIGRKISVRSDLPEGAAIGPFEIEQPIVVPQDINDSDAIMRLGCVLAHAGDHTTFDSDVAGDEFADLFSEWEVSPFQAQVEFVSSQGEPTVKHTLHDICLRVCVDGSSTRFQLIYDAEVVDDATASAVVEALMVTPSVEGLALA